MPTQPMICQLESAMWISWIYYQCTTYDSLLSFSIEHPFCIYVNVFESSSFVELSKLIAQSCGDKF